MYNFDKKLKLFHRKWKSLKELNSLPKPKLTHTIILIIIAFLFSSSEAGSGDECFAHTMGCENTTCKKHWQHSILQHLGRPPMIVGGRLTGICVYCRCPAAHESILPHITSLGEDQNSHSEGRCGYGFRILVKLKTVSWTTVKSGTRSQAMSLGCHPCVNPWEVILQSKCWYETNKQNLASSHLRALDHSSQRRSGPPMRCLPLCFGLLCL